MALHRKLSLAYLTKFTSCFPDAETVEDWCEYWAEGLAGVTAEQIGYGLRYATQRHEWPPTLAEFKACCLALQKPLAALPQKPSLDMPKVEAAIRSIKGAICNPRKPGRWWAKEILEKAAKGEPVHETALRFAKEVCA